MSLFVQELGTLYADCTRLVPREASISPVTVILHLSFKRVAANAELKREVGDSCKPKKTDAISGWLVPARCRRRKSHRVGARKRGDNHSLLWGTGDSIYWVTE